LVMSMLKHKDLDVNATAHCHGAAEFFIDDYRFPSKFYRTPLHIACARGYERIVLLLLNHPNIEANKLVKGLSALEAAIFNGQKNIIQILLNSGKVDINQKNEKGRSALALACMYHSFTAIELILKDPNLVFTPEEFVSLSPYFAGLLEEQPDLTALFLSKAPEGLQ